MMHISTSPSMRRLHKRSAPVTLLLFVLLLAGLTWSPRAQADSPHVIQISTDPYTDDGNVHQTETEPAVASFGGTTVAALMAGISPAAGATNIGWATSFDGGHSWLHGFLSDTTTIVGGIYTTVADPSVNYNSRFGVWTITFLALTNAGPFPGGTAILLSQSHDGLTWSNPISISAGRANEIYDKPWTACDGGIFTSPFWGRCYTEWADVVFASDGSFSLQVDMSTSTDGGQTWGTPLHPAGGLAGGSGQPLVQPNGAVIVPMATIDLGTLLINGIVSFRSTDGGQSWGAATSVTTVSFHTHAAGMRGDPIPVGGMDHMGKIYLIWADCRFEAGCSANDLVLSTTTNGLNWTPVQRIPIDPAGSGVDHFLPGVGIDPSTSGNSANLALVYYYFSSANCDVNTCQLDTGFLTSSNGGSSWSARQQLAGPMQIGWLSGSDAGPFVGDYMAVAYYLHRPLPIFAVASPPLPSGLLQQAMFAVPA